MDLSKATFWGFKREIGRIGVRNHVVILPVDDLSNAASLAVENNIKGTMALPHPYGRLQFGADLDLHFRTKLGLSAWWGILASIPVVAGFSLVIGFICLRLRGPYFALATLAMGEVLNLGRNYVALQGSDLVHPLVTTSLSVIANLDDRSSYVGGVVSYSASDEISVSLGGQLLLGQTFDEYWYYPDALYAKADLFF